MPYCIQNDIENLIPIIELAELTTESGNTPDATIISEIIDQVNSEIDSYLSVRYVIPLASTPKIIKRLSVDIAIYHLYSRRSTVPPIRRTRYEDAINFLRNVALGKIQILGTDGDEMTGTSTDSIKMDSRRRVFSRISWEN